MFFSHRPGCSAIHFACLAVALPIFLPSTASASSTWTGNGANPTWSTPQNWSGNSLPSSSADVIFGTGFSSGSIITFDSSKTVNSLLFNSSQNVTLGAATSPSLTITTGVLTSTASANQTVLSTLYTPAVSWGITSSGAGTLVLPYLYQTGSGARNIDCYGTGTIDFSNLHTNLTGGIIINGPTVLLGSDPSIPDVHLTAGSVDIITPPFSPNIGPNIFIAGTGNSGNGALRTSSGGLIKNLTLTNNATVTADPGVGIECTGNLSDAGQSYTLTKNGAGSLLLDSPANNFTGNISVTAGTLLVGDPDALGSASSVVISGSSASFGLNATNLNRSLFFVSSSLVSAGGPSSLAGVMYVRGSVSINPSSPLTISANITEDSMFSAGLTIGGTSPVTLTGNNTFHNGIHLNSGATLSLGSNTAAGPGAITQPDNSSTINFVNNVTIPNTFSAASFASTSGNNSLTGPITLTADALFGVSPGANLTVAGNLTDGLSSYKLDKLDTGRLVLAGTNSYDGITTVQNGALALASSSSLGTAGVTLGTIATFKPTLELFGGISVNAPLTLSGGAGVNDTTGILYSSADNNTWTGPITLASPSTDNLVNVNASSSLTLAGSITSSPGGSITKIGSGKLFLSGPASYPTLNISKGSAAGSSSAALPASLNINVSAGAAFELPGGVSSLSILNLSGNGVSSGGALRSTFGSNTCAGPIRLLADSSVGVDSSSTLTISSPIDDVGSGFTLTKFGPGTLTLSSPDSYSGGTIVNGGTLQISASSPLGPTAAPLTLNNGSTLRISSSFSSARTINATNSFISVDAGVSFSYFSARITGGFLRGAGTHTLSTSSSFISTTSLQGSILNQTGSSSLTNFTNGGIFTNAAALTWDAGSNSATGILNVNSTLTTDDFANYGLLTIAGGATLTNSLTPFVAAAGSRTTINSGGTLSISNLTSLSLSSLLTNNGTLTGGPLNIYYGGLATGTGSWPAVNLSPGGTFSPGGAMAPSTPNFTTTAWIQPTPGNLSVAAPVTLLADTIADVANSTDSLTLTSQLTASGVTLTKIHPGTLSLTNLRAAALVATDGTLAILPSYTPVSTSSLNSLTITGSAHFDLADNNLVLDYTGSSPLTQTRQYLQAGALTSSSATNNTDNTTALGYAEASQLPPTTAVQIAGILPYDSTTLLIKYTYLGDANLDGKIDADDYALLDHGFALHASTWTAGDFNYDGVVNAADYLLIDKTYILQSGTLSPSFLSMRESQFGDAYVSELLSNLPEPSLVACLFAGSLLLPRAHKRRRLN